MQLSDNRAKSVKNYLVENDIRASRIQCAGVGYNEPRIICANCEAPGAKPSAKRGKGAQCTEEEHYQNRALNFVKLKDK